MTVPPSRSRRADGSGTPTSAPGTEGRGFTRRRFLLGSAAAGAAGLAGVVTLSPWELLGGDPSSPPPVAGPDPAPPGPSGDRILVLVTLYGGNDGLNTVVPAEAGAYLGGRGDLALGAGDVLALGDGLGLHPSLPGLKALWDRGRLAVVRGVGYPAPDRSHFRSMDIWQTGSPSAAVGTGWLGRWLDATGRDPLRAVSVGATVPPALAGERTAAAALSLGPLDLPGGGRLGTGFSRLSAAAPGAGSPLARRVTASGAELLHVRSRLSTLLGDVPGGGAAAGGGGSELAGQLDLVARLVGAGAPTRVYSVGVDGFDTHADEAEAHARVLGEVDRALSGFMSALETLPGSERVVVVAYSEFGRRVAANASGGTDHGTAGPVFVTGAAVRGGFHGDEPGLDRLDDGDLRHTTDFRSLYATLLGQVLGVDPAISLDRAFPTLGFLW